MKPCTKKETKRALKLNDKTKRARTNTFTLDHIIQNRLDFNLNPPYQRGKVWKIEQKEKLIYSILLGRQIGSIHLVVNDPNFDPLDNAISGVYHDVLDAKQRIDTIFEFVDNKFTIPIDFGDGSPCCMYSYSDFQQGVQNIEHTRILQRARKALAELQVTISTYPPMSLKDQIEIFEDVNLASPLVGNEKMYGRHCFLKIVLKYLFDSIMIPNLGDHFHVQISEDRRESGLRLLHSIIFLAFGERFDSTFKIQPYSAKCLEKSASLFEKVLIEHEVTSNMSITDDVINSLGDNYVKTWKTLKDAAICTSEVLSYNRVSKKHDVNFIMDLVIFFCHKLQQGETKRHIQDSVKEFFEMARMYATQKKEQDLKSHTTHEKRIAMRFEALESCYRYCVVDTGDKGKILSNSDKLIAAFETDGSDPITGADLGLNPDYDHVPPKSCHSEIQVEAMTPTSNRILKGATTLQTAKSIVDLNKKHGNT